MTEKGYLLWMYLLTLLVFCNMTTYASSQEPVVYINPASYEASEVGVIFTINVSIANVTNLYAYHVILWYNTTLLDGVDVELPPNHFLTPVYGSNNIFKMDEIEDDHNATHGVLGMIATLTGPEPQKNGSGILVTITFNATKQGGPSPLKLYHPGSTYPVQLSDPDGNRIACTAIDGSVEVVPEFPSFLIMPVIVIITLMAITLERKYY